MSCRGQGPGATRGLASTRDVVDLADLVVTRKGVLPSTSICPPACSKAAMSSAMRSRASSWGGT